MGLAPTAANSSRLPSDKAALMLLRDTVLQSHLGQGSKMRTGRFYFIKYTGLLVAVVGHVCSLVALFLPQWLTISRDFQESDMFMLGLWEVCMTPGPGDSMCKAFTNLLELSTDIRMARVLMCLAGATGTLGFLAVLPGLSCLRYWGHLGSSFEQSMNIAGGALFFLAGLTTFVPVSYVAFVTVQKFWSPKFPTDKPQWNYGSAMFFGWTGSFFLLTGGLFWIMSQLYVNRLTENLTLFSPKLDIPRKVPFDKVDDMNCVPQKDMSKS